MDCSPTVTEGGKLFWYQSGCMDGEVAVCGISLLVASTCIMKWEMKPPAENQKGGEQNERLKREEDVYDSHLKGPKGELTRGIW